MAQGRNCGALHGHTTTEQFASDSIRDVMNARHACQLHMRAARPVELHIVTRLIEVNKSHFATRKLTFILGSACRDYTVTNCLHACATFALTAGIAHRDSDRTALIDQQLHVLPYA
ncbi:hypothetical protein [Paraburkholderia sp. EG304]|uniref:hypothetical protein n=1 Tax=Paraburkholderia sp. EG304 TaxID=3237015 RepID=UPI0039796F87